MKIGFLLTEFPNQTSISIWRVAKALAAEGNKVEIVSTRRAKGQMQCHEELVEHAKQVFYSWPPRISSFIFVLFCRPRRVLSCIKYCLKLNESNLPMKLKVLALLPSAASIFRFAEENDLDHFIVHSCSTAAHLINLCFRLGGPKFSLRLGGDLDVYGKDHLSKFREAHFILPASLNNRDEVLERKIKNRERLLPTWLGVDTRVFSPKKTLSAKGSNIKLVSIARLNPAKGHSYVFSAIAALKNEGYQLDYYVAGSGPNEKELRKQVINLGLDDVVHFVGQVDEKQAVELLRKCDISILASVGLGEASPMSLIEAMSCGLAVITTDIGGTKQIVTDGVDGIVVKQKDIEGLKNQIRRLLDDESLRVSLGQSSRRSAERFFDSTAVAQAIVHAIKSNDSDNLEKFSPILTKLK